MATSEGNNEVANAVMPPNKGEAQPVSADMKPNDGEPTNQDMQTNGEEQPGNTDTLTDNTETQPADANIQKNNEDTHPSDSQTQPVEGQSQPVDIHTKEINPAAMETELNSGETQPDSAETQPKSRETQPADTGDQPKDEGALPHDTKAQPDAGESQQPDAEAQPEARESQLPDAEAQPDSRESQPPEAETRPNVEEAKPPDAVTQPEIRETHQADAEMHSNDGEIQQADSEMQPNQMDAQPMDAEMQLVNEEMQPNNGEMQSVGAEIQQKIGDSMPNNAEMQPTDMSIKEEMQLNNSEMQPAGAELHPNNGELQPLDSHMQPSTEEMETFGAETQLHSGEMQTFYAEFQPNNGGMQPYDSETQPNAGQIQEYDPGMHHMDGQIEAYHPETQPSDGQVQAYEPETLPSDGQIQPFNPETQGTDGQIQPYDPETQPNKRRKKKSVVWEHFTIEAVSPGCRRAICNRCKQSFAYSTGSKVAGTSHLKRHIAKGTCAAFIPNQDNSQSSPFTPSQRTPGTGNITGTKRRYRTSTSPYVAFDQDRCRQEIAKMIIMHDYPLHMVEHPGFVSFVKNLQPRFDVGSFSTVQGDCIATYLSEKQNVMRLIEGVPGRVCLTLDLWTSNQTLGYVLVTGHFIDSDWKLQKRILNVVMEPYPDSDTVLRNALSACHSEWNLDGKIFSITISEQLNEAGLENLRAYLAVKNPLVLNGQLLMGNCIGRTLSCMAKDLLGGGQEIVKKIRESVKYVKTSDSHEEKFLELKQQLQVPSEKSLSLDDQTKWNTTYQMLVAASELKEVFSCLDTSDPDYKKAPTMEDWKQVETICTYLKLFYDAANVLTNTSNPTAITCFHEVWKIHSELGRAVSSEDPFVVNLTKAMYERINKYWKDCSLVLAMAVVMDPRFKMKLVEFTFTKLYGEDAPTYVRIVDEGIHELFDEYVALPLPLTPTYAEEGHAGGEMRTDEHGDVFLQDHGLTDFDMYIMETTNQQTKSELDQYLEESLLPRVQEVDVLSWWKMNKLKYPTLSKMARDILTTPVCTVGSDSVFDTIPKKMDGYRSSLRPVTVEALICAKDWLSYGPSEVLNAPLKMEF